MAEVKPYKVICTSPGDAEVIDRKTGERVGYVLQDFHGRWEAFNKVGKVLTKTRHRIDAARHVWETRPV